MIIFSEHNSPRINFILDYIFTERLGIPFQMTHSVDNLIASSGAKINYSHQLIQNAINIIPEGLLFETNIRKKKPSVSFKNGIPIIFWKHGEANLTFDVFSAIFYFISRYEEYQPFEPDIHDRFSANESLAFKNTFLNQPVVDHWILYIKQELLQKYPELTFKEETFSAIPTIDIDSPWCYRHKGLLRNAGGLLRDLLHFQINHTMTRLIILFRIKPDPWFIFDWMKKVLEENNLQAILFVHVGKHAKYDKSVSFKNRYFRRAIKGLSQNFSIGLHPSYHSAEKQETLKSELYNLSMIINQQVTSSRQHYLKIKLPEYYRMLIDAGITDDYTMGFADKPGFRAGTTRPFKWYDLKLEVATQLCAHPFAAMDRTVNTHEQLTPAGAQLIYNELIEQVQNVNGLFITLWHNESFSDMFEWKGWNKIFETVMQKTANKL